MIYLSSFNIIANCLELKGKEYAASNSYGIVDYCGSFSGECSYTFGEDDYVKNGMSLLEAKTFLASKEGSRQEEYIRFSQEKYSNGETSMQYFEKYLQPDALYLLDEPEVSLSPANQVLLAEEINRMTRLLGCQFIIATHSPFMLGTLNAKIYNLDTEEYDITKWSDLDNVRYFYNFFKNTKKNFNNQPDRV